MTTTKMGDEMLGICSLTNMNRARSTVVTPSVHPQGAEIALLELHAPRRSKVFTRVVFSNLLYLYNQQFTMCCHSIVDIDGGYAEWGAWTPCKGACGLGEKVRERTCTNPIPKGKGKDCSSLGSTTEEAECDTGIECPSKSIV